MRSCSFAKGVRIGRLFHCPAIYSYTFYSCSSTYSSISGLSLRGGSLRGESPVCASLSHTIRKPAMFVALVWVLLSFLWLSPCYADNCELRHADATVRVTEVIDGDTVQLSDRQSLRFMSINTPEIDHKHHTAEPVAEAARAALDKLIGPSRKMKVQYGRHQRVDRHGRLLAHVFTQDGVNIQQQLLKQGMGFWIAMPPNLALMACYHDAEQAARNAHRGVWALDYYQPRSPTQLHDNERGFRFVRGVVGRIGESRRSIWLNLHDAGAPVRRKARVALRISRDDLHYFKTTNFKQWLGKSIVARGWMYPYKGQLIIRIKHPAALDWGGTNTLTSTHSHKTNATKMNNTKANMQSQRPL